ncbi:MAG: hypothetical protein RIC19_20115 [Phaeodactylibacter sp.]|uniref:hypothetical protein n=1 Tax=Phaeodactylibacter sp. TaxID=1940289 RepID=UPI0032ECB437
MRSTLLSLVFVFLLSGCGNGSQEQVDLPEATALLSLEAIQETVQEPVRKVTAVAAGLGEKSACIFLMPARAEMQMLHFYIFDPTPAQDIPQLQVVASQWQEHNAGAGYEILQGTSVPMAWFPGEAMTYPATTIALFKQATLVITGVSQEHAKSLSYQIMLQQNWQ